MYAPWRENYTNTTARTSTDSQDKDDCVFCIQLQENNDTAHFILRRFKHHNVMLNLYPYNAGHLLIITNNHIANLTDCSKEARTELIELTAQATDIVKKAFDANGVNVGINLGKAAGAGMPAHLHMHVLPRFTGDTNFMPTLANTKVISFDLKEIYHTLKGLFDAVVL